MNGEGKNQLKKGPWTAEEDEMLMQHVRKYGEGRWSAVQKHSGLARCGKSCRLRWANHLRPDLKKGSFTPDEEKLILELHDKYGNKWARIAAELPGRTDNEIKNFWNSRLKRRLRDVDRNQGQQYYSSQPTTPTTSSDFQFQVLSSPLPPKSHLASNSSSSLPYTIKRPPPLLSSPSWFERQRRLSSATDETLLNTTGFSASPSMSTSSFLYSSPTTTSSGLLSPLRSQNSPMLSPLFSSSSQPASPTLAFSSMPNSSITPHSPTLFSTLSQPSSARITSLTSPHSPMLSSQAGSEALCSPGSPILSLVGSTSSMYIPGENSSISLIRNQHANELSGTSSFLFDGLSSYASGYSHNPELPSNQISGMSSEFTLDQNVNLAKMHSYDVLIEDPSQSDVILDLKMKAGWTPGLKRKPRLDVAPASKINMAMTRAADESSMVHMSKVNGESMNEQTRPEVTFDQGQSLAELQDSCGSFEDMFKQSQAMESAMISGSESCLVFTEEKLFLEPQNDCINFSPLHSSAGDNLEEEQTLEQMNSMHEDLSKLLGFDPASFAVPELYTDCGEISDKQYSDGTTDNNFNDELS